METEEITNIRLQDWECKIPPTKGVSGGEASIMVLWRVWSHSDSEWQYLSNVCVK